MEVGLGLTAETKPTSKLARQTARQTFMEQNHARR
jgi:hypothetical protein